MTRNSVDNNEKRVVQKDSTLKAMSLTLVFGQFIGLLPVCNVFNQSQTSGLIFKWHSIRSLFAATLIGFSIVELSMATRRLIKLGGSLSGVTVILFYGSTTGTAVLFYYLAASGRWKKLMMEFERMEEIFTKTAYEISKTQWTLCKKLRILSLVVILAGIIEHLFYLLAKMTNVFAQIKKCKFKIFFYEHFLKTERRHLYAVIPFNYFIALPFEITNTCNTVAWTFIDLFIMMHGISLTHRFQQISHRIQGHYLQPMPDEFWHQLRLDFVCLQELVEKVDDTLSYLIVLASFTDVYFTCFLLFNSFGDFPEKLNALYFYFSIIFIISRTLSMLYFSTTVNEASQRPYKILRSIPHNAWGPEVDRFAYQLRQETIALSGRKFFYFTRNVILTLIGTIITYELVILDHVVETPEIVQKTCHVVYNDSQLTN